MQTALASSVQQVPIDLGDRSYTILIGQGLLDDPAAWDGLPQAASARW
jgi:3-dehydroquinate synthase